MGEEREAFSNLMIRSQSFSEPVPWAVTFSSASQAISPSTLGLKERPERTGVVYLSSLSLRRVWLNPAQLDSGKTVSLESRHC